MSFFKNHSEWPLVPLKSIATLKRGYDLPAGQRNDGVVPIYAANGQNGTHNEIKIKGPGVITGRSGTIGKVHYCVEGFWPLNTSLYVMDFHGNNPRWVYYMLSAFKLERFAEGAGVPTLNRNLVHDELIPLPPLAEQKRIAAILDMVDAIRHKRQQGIRLADDFLRMLFLDMFGDPVTNPKGWEVKPLGEIIKLASGNGLSAKDMNPAGVYPVYGGNGINGVHSEYMFEDPQLVIGRVGAYCGVIHLTKERSWVTDNALYVREYLQDVNIHYLAKLLEIANLNQYAGKAAQPLVSGSRIYPLEMMFPPLDAQMRFEEVKQKFSSSKFGLDASLDYVENLFSALRQAAFSGGL